LTESDDDLLQGCRAGSQAAWKELVSRHTRRVFALAYRFTGRVDEAEDLTQEIFVRVYQSLDHFQERGSFSAWLLVVARNQAIDHYRSVREERLRRGGGTDALEAIASQADGPLRSLEREERVSLVRKGLRSLPRELREALILCDLEELPYDEIAALLKVPLGTVKSRINRGRLELAKRLLNRREGTRA
jgi:RNA polymerase sigma-70 factor (ECF subfamily)